LNGLRRNRRRFNFFGGFFALLGFKNRVGKLARD
jgi:hypothetical protein